MKDYRILSSENVQFASPFAINMSVYCTLALPLSLNTGSGYAAGPTDLELLCSPVDPELVAVLLPLGFWGTESL